jgi:hypothetical protein
VISAHRRRHRRVWLVLAITLPILLWLALRARPSPVRNEAIPEGVERVADDTRSSESGR